MKDYLASMKFNFIGISLLIEPSCEKLDYEDIQYKVLLKMHHPSNYWQLLIQK